MSEDVAERVSYLEREGRRFAYAIDGMEKRTDFHLQEMNLHLEEQDKKLEVFRESVDKRFDAQDKKLEDFKESVEKRFEEQDKKQEVFKESVNERFDHVYGQLADVNANVMDIRNMLATLIAKHY
jgi:chromosome segregation ATPase